MYHCSNILILKPPNWSPINCWGWKKAHHAGILRWSQIEHMKVLSGFALKNWYELVRAHGHLKDHQIHLDSLHWHYTAWIASLAPLSTQLQPAKQREAVHCCVWFCYRVTLPILPLSWTIFGANKIQFQSNKMEGFLEFLQPGRNWNLNLKSSPGIFMERRVGDIWKPGHSTVLDHSWLSTYISKPSTNLESKKE